MKTFTAKDHYEKKTRDNRETFYTLKDSSPLHDILQDWIRASHLNGKILPSDFIYDMCIECLKDFENIFDNEKTEEELKENLEEAFYETYMSNYQLREWFLKCVGDDYIDEAIEEGFISIDPTAPFINSIQQGYNYHRYTIVQLFPIQEVLDFDDESTTQQSEA